MKSHYNKITQQMCPISLTEVVIDCILTGVLRHRSFSTIKKTLKVNIKSMRIVDMPI